MEAFGIDGSAAGESTMHADLFTLYEKLVRLGNAIDHSNMDWFYQDESGQEAYPDQQFIMKSMDYLYSDVATHWPGGEIFTCCTRCDIISAYIEFRMEFSACTPRILRQILSPEVSLETKRELRESGLTNRESLDLIDSVRKKSRWMLSYGSYESFLARFIEETVPDFADYC